MRGSKTSEKDIIDILRLHNDGYTSRKICHLLGWKKSRKSTVNNVLNIFREKDPDRKPRILTLDVETSPHKGYFFGMFKQNMSPAHIELFPYMLTFACKWLGEDEIYGYSLPDFPTFKKDIHSDKELIEKLWEYFDEADVVICHNARFDNGWFTQQCALHNIIPPSPYKLICTFKALKSCTSLPSKSLNYATKYYRTLDEKLGHSGISLWKRCMEGDVDAFYEMLTYNRGDIPTCEELYIKIRPYMKSHPNMALYTNSIKPVCRVCASENMSLIVGKYAMTDVSKFPVYRCNDCGKVQRSGKAINSMEHRQSQYRNVV